MQIAARRGRVWSQVNARGKRGIAAGADVGRRLRDTAGALEAVKFPREGAGLLSSLVETDGLIELGEKVTLVEPGQAVGFLSYASLS